MRIDSDNDGERTLHIAVDALPREDKIATVGRSSTERELLMGWNATRQSYPLDKSISQLVEVQAEARPDAVTLSLGRQELHYRELNQRANQLAHHLRRYGVGPGTLVGLCVERSFNLVIGLLGILKAGGAYVPLDPSYPVERLNFMIHDAGMPVLISQQNLVAHLATAATHVICLDDPATALSQESPENLIATAKTTDLAYVIYTSGSTGQPKGVQIMYRSLLNLVYWHQRAFNVTAADRATQLTSPAFDAAGWELWPYLTLGASVYLPDDTIRKVPALLRDWLVSNGITITFLPTALAESMLLLPWPPTTALRYMLTGADKLQQYPPSSLPFALVNNYGPTEATVVATSGLVVPTERSEMAPPIGRPIANTQIFILDAQRQQVPIGEVGEIYIGGEGLAKGYLGRPTLTADTFLMHAFDDHAAIRLYKTGDLGYFLPDGQIAFLGRADEQVKLRGYRIELGEIAYFVNKHHDVRSAVVVDREDTPGGKRLVAYIVLASHAHVSASSLREFLSTCLPQYMLPATFVVLNDLPLTPNGKIDRAALPLPTAANILQDKSITEPVSPIEERLVAIIASLVNVEHISVDDNFFTLGGHSLLAMQLIAQIASNLGVNLSLLTIFESPTVRQLAEEVERLIAAKIEMMDEEAFLGESLGQV